MVSHDLVMGYRGYRDIGISPSLPRGCRRTPSLPRGCRPSCRAEIHRGSATHAFQPLLDLLRLECGSRRIVHYLGGGYSAAGQEPREDRGDQQCASHFLFPFMLCSERIISSPAGYYTRYRTSMLRCKIFIFTSRLWREGRAETSADLPLKSCSKSSSWSEQVVLFK